MCQKLYVHDLICSSKILYYCVCVCACVRVCVKVKVVQSCLTLCDPMGYTVHGILQAKILEWVAIPFSRGSSQPRDQTQVSHITGRFFTIWATREAQEYWSGEPIPSPLDRPIPGTEPGSPALQADSLPTELLGKLMFVYEGALLLSYITDETLRTLGKWKKGQIWGRLTNLISSNIECCWSKLVGFATCEDSQTHKHFQRVVPTTLALWGGQQTQSNFISKPNFCPQTSSFMWSHLTSDALRMDTNGDMLFFICTPSLCPR